MANTKKEDTGIPVSCLKNKKITIKYIMRKDANITNEDHPLYGGLHKNATISYVAPLQTNGFVVPDLLTSDEEDYLEYAMHFTRGYLSPHNIDNFWVDTKRSQMNSLTLGKDGITLDLSQPAQYLLYVIARATKDEIAPSHDALKSNPKSTYRFEMVDSSEAEKISLDMLTSTANAYKEFGKIENDFWKCKTIYEIIAKHNVNKGVAHNWLKSELFKIIQKDPQLFVDTATDKYLDAKVILAKGNAIGIISVRNSNYYLRDSNKPLCNEGDATYSVAAAYIMDPVHSELLEELEKKTSEI